MPSKAHNRREPQKGKKGFSTHKGFTLIELLITIAVVAIIASLALPSYQNILEKRQVTSGAEQLSAFLSSVKSNAVMLGEDIAVSINTGDNQCIGYRVGGAWCDCTQAVNTEDDFCGVDLDGNGIIEAGEQTVFAAADLKHPEVLTGITLNRDGSALEGSPVLVYDSVRGLLQTTAGTEADEAVLALVSTGDAYALNVVISQTGRLGICSPGTDDHAVVPGYELCQ